MMLLGKIGMPGAINLALALAARRRGWSTASAKLIGFIVAHGRLAVRSANGTASSRRAGMRACTTTAWRWSARASSRLLLSIVLFGTLSQSFFPPQNSDYSRVNITMPPGSTLKQTEAVDRPRRGASCRRIRTSNACSSG